MRRRREIQPAPIATGPIVIGAPKRCATSPSIVAYDGSCGFCFAWNGEQCRIGTVQAPAPQKALPPASAASKGGR